MKIVAIASYDSQPGELDAVLALPEGKTEEEIVLAWVRKKYNKPKLTWKEFEGKDCHCLGWFTYEVEE